MNIFPSAHQLKVVQNREGVHLYQWVHVALHTASSSVVRCKKSRQRSTYARLQRKENFLCCSCNVKDTLCAAASPLRQFDRKQKKTSQSSFLSWMGNKDKAKRSSGTICALMTKTVEACSLSYPSQEKDVEKIKGSRYLLH